MDGPNTLQYSRRQWKALAKARLRRGEPGSHIESEFVDEGLAPQIAAEIVEEAIRSARVCATALLIGSASFGGLGLLVTLASYSGAMSRPHGGTYLFWFGPIVGGGIAALIALARLMDIRR